MSPSAKWKGKARALDYDYDYEPIQRRDGVEGDGNADGIVLPLDMVGSGVYDVAYTLPVKFGSKSQQFSLQVDTGSSDLWVASTSCSSSSCKLTDGRLYDPSGSRATGQEFTIPYLQGSASGPIVWDRVVVGGYEIDNQALAAANDVESEPLTPKFSGILGLALPLNSIIASDIPPVTSNAPDGAAWASNLFSITPTSQAPAARFLSLSLARPGSDRVPSLLGIGHHPSSLVPDPSKINYSTLVSDHSGTLFWKVSVRAISVYVNREKRDVDVGRSNTGAVFPSAVVDSGVPLILTTSAVANAIYGAIGVEPGSDGKYYVPCTTPLNLTITLDSRPEIPIHPLDLTAYPPDASSSTSCVGLIQTADAQLTQHDGSIGDMILGVPFLRNVYSVMAYVAPASDGSFPPLTTTTTGDGDDDDGNTIIATPQAQTIKPRFGLLPLTDPTVALQEFNTVRVLNQPLPPSSSSSAGTSNNPNAGTGSDNNTKTVDVGRKLSTGVIVALALAGVVVLFAGIWGVRWVLGRRNVNKRREREKELMALGMAGAGAGYGRGWEGLTMDQKDAYALVRGRGMGGVFAPVTEDGVLMGKDGGREKSMGSSVGSGSDVDRTMWGNERDGGKGEFGVRDVDHKEEEEGENDDTLVAGAIASIQSYTHDREHEHNEDRAASATVPLVASRSRSGSSPPSSPEVPHFPVPRHQYADSDVDVAVGGGGAGEHRQMTSVDVPLLASSFAMAAKLGPQGQGRHERGYTLDDTTAYDTHAYEDDNDNDERTLECENLAAAERKRRLQALHDQRRHERRYTLEEDGDRVIGWLASGIMRVSSSFGAGDANDEDAAGAGAGAAPAPRRQRRRRRRSSAVASRIRTSSSFGSGNADADEDGGGGAGAGAGRESFGALSGLARLSASTYSTVSYVDPNLNVGSILSSTSNSMANMGPGPGPGLDGVTEADEERVDGKRQGNGKVNYSMPLRAQQVKQQLGGGGRSS